MPKVAIKPMQRALITQPTAMLKPAPLTAENICPAMMDPMIPQPNWRIMLRRHVILDGQYPMKYRPRICQASKRQIPSANEVPNL